MEICRPRRTFADFVEACREAGLSPTPQREVIYSVLAASEDHPTADEVHQRVREVDRRISLATVYRNLRLFADAGLIEEVATGGNFARYDANQATHYHLVCKRCGSVADVAADVLPDVGNVRRVVEGFEVQDLKVNLLGLCAACRAASEA
ncbi:MAG: transcriptional repressor [Candidatus Dadabacteria bacterium]|nr:MAG: transcriptional repressor [Candidatus Dadabacteria bacterium]